MTDEKKVMSDELRLMAKTLKEMQLMLEPIRDKALDEKARLTGYAQCAEQMISIIIAKMVDFEKKAEAVDNLPDKEPIEEVIVDKVRKKKAIKQENT